eukprot:2266248-Rhodomonas_salina.1
MEELDPSKFVCSLGLSNVQDPVTCTDGHIYARASIQSWLADNSTSPTTGLGGVRKPDAQAEPHHSEFK